MSEIDKETILKLMKELQHATAEEFANRIQRLELFDVTAEGIRVFKPEDEQEVEGVRWKTND